MNCDTRIIVFFVAIHQSFSTFKTSGPGVCVRVRVRTVMSQDKTEKLNLKCNISFNIRSVQIHTLPTSILMIVLCELCECRCMEM